MRIALRLSGLVLLSGVSLVAQTQPASPTSALGVDQMILAPRDIWGESAIRQSDGASYEFFEPLLPPLRYVNTVFKHYPIMLSAPGAERKARFVSNGSGVNLRAEKPPMWHDWGTAIRFLVGNEEPFGADVSRMVGPRFVEGWLPIVEVAYRSGSLLCRQEAFASVDERLAPGGALLIRFGITGKGETVVRAVPEGPGLHYRGSRICGDRGETIVVAGEGWTYDGPGRGLSKRLREGDTGDLLVFAGPVPTSTAPSKPITVPAETSATQVGPDADAGAEPPLALQGDLSYDAQREQCVRAWKEIIGRAVRLEMPEPRVNDAWRSMLVANFMTAVGDRMHYSAGNAYAKLYEAECGDATRSLLLYGYADAARRMVGPLLDFQREATRFHVAGHKLQVLAEYYWITRDSAYIDEKQRKWKEVVDFILSSREENGLVHKDRFAGDIPRLVYSLKSNANCWRGLCDIAAVLRDMGRLDEAKRIADEASGYKKAILAAVEKSIRHETRPPFIPIALFESDEPYDPLTATRLGSYYDLVMPYVLGSGIFAGTEKEEWLLGYLEQHGGIAMGMIRTTPHEGQFKGEPGVNVLYGLRYMLTLLRRDEREKALVGFYGQLAQGVTRDTFIGGEGSRFKHGDANGRSFYLPPNTTSNAMFLLTLRYLLVQDWDLDDDGRPETLRLLYGVPRRWMHDGKSLVTERMPTAFGEVSVRATSRLKQGAVEVEVTPPARPVRRMLLRVPLPDGWKAVSAEMDGAPLPLAGDGAMDLTGRTQSVRVLLHVEHTSK